MEIDDTPTPCIAKPNPDYSLNGLPSLTDNVFDATVALKKARIDLDVDLEPQPVVLSFRGVPIFSLGNISLIIGKAKSMKTFFLCLIVARILGVDVDYVDVFLKGKVVFFDTEQSRYDVKRFIDRVARLVGTPIELDVYSLRPHSPSERKEIIDVYLQQHRDISLCFIDGIRDLVTDVNNPSQATEISTWLLKLTDEYNIHICTVLHQNKGDDYARGHLGTELVNKAETTISITKDNSDGFSIVEPKFTRGREFEQFAFEIDEQGLPRIKVDWQKEGARKPRDIPGAFDKAFHEEVLAHAFGITETPKYSDLIQNLKVVFQQKGYDWGDNKIKNFITYYKDQGMIMQEGAKGTRHSKYKLCAV